MHLTGRKPDWIKSKSHVVVAVGFLYHRLIGDAVKDIISYVWVYVHAYTCRHVYINICFICMEYNGLCTVMDIGSERKDFA